ncbi:lysophospholipid acyltransferase [Campylobacter geochelonis]|nr:lysophospholipid acyltransferase [Campylobacter geochelonis]
MFALFGLICLVGNLVFIPIVLLNLQRFKIVENLARDMIFISWRSFILATKFFKYLKFEFDGYENLGKNSQIIIANHPSLLDVVFLISHIRRANCVVKSSLGQNLFLSLAIKAANYIPNTQNELLLEKAIKVLKNGECLVIFPEGTRTKDEIKFHKAAFYIAINSAKILTPIAINMQPKSLKKGESWHNTPKNLISYKLSVLKSIDITAFASNRANPVRVRELYKMLENLYKKENL